MTARFICIGTHHKTGTIWMRKVWRAIESRRLEAFSYRDAWHPLRGSFPRADDMRPAIETLVERHYLFPVDQEKRPGRPSELYRVNAAIVRRWAL